MSSRSLSILAGALLVALMCPLAQGTDSCGGGCPTPPSNARSLSSPPFPLPVAFAPILTTAPAPTLKKGKAKRIVMVEAMVVDIFNTGSFPAIFPDVNLTLMEPTALVGPALGSAGEFSCTGAAPNCSVSGTWWLDLDAFPALIGVPLIVSLNGVDLAASGDPFIMTMSVRLQKK
jgi:hypothetical protein